MGTLLVVGVLEKDGVKDGAAELEKVDTGALEVEANVEEAIDELDNTVELDGLEVVVGVELEVGVGVGVELVVGVEVVVGVEDVVGVDVVVGVEEVVGGTLVVDGSEVVDGAAVVDGAEDVDGGAVVEGACDEELELELSLLELLLPDPLESPELLLDPSISKTSIWIEEPEEAVPTQKLLPLESPEVTSLTPFLEGSIAQGRPLQLSPSHTRRTPNDGSVFLNGQLSSRYTGFHPILTNVLPFESELAPATYGDQFPTGLLLEPQIQASDAPTPGALT